MAYSGVLEYYGLCSIMRDVKYSGVYSILGCGIFWGVACSRVWCICILRCGVLCDIYDVAFSGVWSIMGCFI